MSNDKNKQSISVSYSRTNAVPLDGSTVFSSFAEAAEYVNKENTTAYEGQIITVDDGNSVNIYKVIKDSSFASGLDLEDIRYFTFKNLQNAGIEGLHVVDRDSSDTGHQTAVISICSCSNDDSIDNSFRDNTNLKYVKLSSRLPSIGDYAFEDCYGLTSIDIPNSVTSIGNWAFENCYRLTSITIPNSVTSIGIDAFAGCSGLTSITIPFVGDGAVQTHFGFIFGATSGDSNNEYVPASLKTVVITGGTSIGDCAFSSCGGLTSVTISDSVTSIGDDAFYECTNLTSITIPDSVMSIGGGAFYACGRLTSITIPDSVTSIGSAAFQYCSKLEHIKLPTDIYALNDYVFASCSNLKSIEIPHGASYIDMYAFSNCNNLKEVKFNSVDLSGIGNHAFSGCSSLEEISAGHVGGGTNIGDYAFQGCTNLKKVVLPIGSIESYHNTPVSIFKDCNNIESITLPHIPKVNTRNTRCLAALFYDDNRGYDNSLLPSSLAKITLTNQANFDTQEFDGCVDLHQVNLSLDTTRGGELYCSGTVLSFMSNLWGVSLPCSVMFGGDNLSLLSNSYNPYGNILIFYPGSESDWNSSSNQDIVSPKQYIPENITYTLIPNCTNLDKVTFRLAPYEEGVSGSGPTCYIDEGVTWSEFYQGRDNKYAEEYSYFKSAYDFSDMEILAGSIYLHNSSYTWEINAYPEDKITTKVYTYFTM